MRCAPWCRSRRASMRSVRRRMQSRFVRCAYLRRRALRCVNRVEVLFHLLDLAIVHDQEEMMLILISLAVLYLRTARGTFEPGCDSRRTSIRGRSPHISGENRAGKIPWISLWIISGIFAASKRDIHGFK